MKLIDVLDTLIYINNMRISAVNDNDPIKRLLSKSTLEGENIALTGLMCRLPADLLACTLSDESNINVLFNKLMEDIENAE